MKRLIFLNLIFALAILSAQILPAHAGNAKKTEYKILIAIYDDNEDYRTCREIFRKELPAAAEKNGFNVRFAELIATSATKEEFIAQLKRISPDVDMVFTCGTSNTQAVKEAGIAKPVLFSAVANPKRAGFVETYHSPGTNFTGCYCFVSADSQLRILRRALPEAKSLGILYNHEDPSAFYQAEQWKKRVNYAGDFSITEFLIPEELSSDEEMEKLTDKMAGKVDVIVTTADNKVSQFGKGMIESANRNKIPTYAGLGHLVDKGALISLEFNFAKAVEIINIPQAIEIMQGIPAANIPVGTLPEYDLVINLKTAKKLGVKFSKRIIDSAGRIIK